MQYEDYNIEELARGVFAIDDAKKDSMYLIEGEEKALLIDTCTMKDDILPMLRTLTEKPIELVITHAHIDHMYHAGEFSTVYLHENDIKAWKKGILRLLMFFGFGMFDVPRKKYDVSRYIPITEESTIPLGGNDLKVILGSSHTPGSSIIVDEKHKMLFIGDIVGSGGASAWMWLPGSSDISTYRKNLERLLQELEPYKDYQFLSGHRPTMLPSEENPEGLPFGYEIFEDMYELCDRMLKKQISPIKKERMSVFRTFQYAYGSTGMWVRKVKIR